MQYHKAKTPLMKEGIEKELMTFILCQVKRIHGLTTHLDKQAGVNGKWVNPDMVYDIPARKLLKILIHKFHYQDEDALWNDWESLYREILKLARKHATEFSHQSRKS